MHSFAVSSQVTPLQVFPAALTVPKTPELQSEKGMAKQELPAHFAGIVQKALDRPEEFSFRPGSEIYCKWNAIKRIKTMKTVSKTSLKELFTSVITTRGTEGS